MFLYIVHRTQIYLEEEQSRRLAERARSTGRTRSTLIREAIDAYLGATDEGESELERPSLALAWSACTRAFGEEAKQDRVFEESLFWVVTRQIHCFY